MTRRVVTGHDKDGKAVFVSDGEPPRTVAPRDVPIRFYELWATEEVPTVPGSDDLTPSIASLIPGPHGTRFRTVVFPPDEDRETTADFLADFAAQAPGFPEVMEPDHPGMHTTDTVDYGIVVDGEIDLELDDGATVLMKAGDCVVQNGTRHAWKNRSGRPATVAFIMIGARRP